MYCLLSNTGLKTVYSSRVTVVWRYAQGANRVPLYTARKSGTSHVPLLLASLWFFASFQYTCRPLDPCGVSRSWDNEEGFFPRYRTKRKSVLFRILRVLLCTPFHACLLEKSNE